MKIYKGVRVLDLSRILVGPFATMQLSDLGAEVIKVESFDGDETRKWGPPYLDQLSTYFISINRNKKSICVDLKKGRDLILEFAKQSDVIVENFSTGVVEKLGLDYKSITKVKPDIIYASINGFGSEGTLKHDPGFDFIVQAETGLMHITGEPNREPMKVGVAIVDVLTGLYTSNAIQAALYQKQTTGKGSFIQTSLYESAIASLVNVSSMYINGSIDMKRMGNIHPSISPYGAYKINDDYIVIGAAQNNQYLHLCEILGMDKCDTRFKDNSDRVTNRYVLQQIIEDKLKSWNSHDFVNALRAHKVPVGKVRSVGDCLNSQQAQDIHMIHKIGNQLMIRSPLKFNGDYLLNLYEAPNLNQHRDEICELFQVNNVQQLINDGILKI